MAILFGKALLQMKPQPIYSFTVDNPIGKKNRMRSGRGRVWKAPEVEAMEFRTQIAAKRAAQALQEPLSGAIRVEMVYQHLEDRLLVQVQEVGKKTRRRRKDIQNMTDVVLDAMEGILYNDDAQVEHLTVRLGSFL